MNNIPQEIQVALTPAVIEFLKDVQANAPELQCFISGFAQCQKEWSKDQQQLQATIQTLSGHLKLINVNCNDQKDYIAKLEAFIRELLVYMAPLASKRNLDKSVINGYIDEGNILLRSNPNK